MAVRSPSLPRAGVAFLLALAVGAGPPPGRAEEPLPRGALARFGVPCPILRGSPAVALVPPGYTTFLAPTTTGGVRRYDLASGRPLDSDGVVGPGLVVVSADGKRAAVALPGSLTVVETATGKRLPAVEPPGGVLLVGTPGVALSADGKVLHTFVGHQGPVTALRFSPDGKALASGAQDSSVLLWDLSRISEGK